MKSIRHILTGLIVLTIIALVIVVGLFAFTETDLGKQAESFISSLFFGMPEQNHVRHSSDADIDVELIGCENLPEPSKNLVKDYFSLWYASLCEGEREQIEQFYAYQTEDMLLDLLCLDYASEIRKMSLAKQKCDGADVNVYCISIGTDDFDRPEYTFSVTAALTLDEKSVWTETSEHVFVFEEKYSDCEICSHSCSSSYHRYTEEVLTDIITQAGWTRADLSYTYLEKYMGKALNKCVSVRKSYISAAAESFAAEIPTPDSVEFPYDSEAAVQYAEQHIVYPDSRYIIYSDNSANFISQCVHAGGIPMDMQGKAALQWKWYSEELNTAREHEGCSESWYDTEKLYAYLEQNTGFGVSAVCGSPFSSGGAGDLIFLKTGGKVTDVVIITEVINGDFGKPADFRVLDDYEVPLGNLAFDEAVLVKISGYNTVNLE